MRSIASLVVLTVFLFTQLQAQRTHYATLKGIVIDSVNRQPIEAATVSVFLVADSSLINYSITNKKGEFLIRDIPQSKSCRLLVSYSGLNSYTQDFSIAPETKDFIINAIQLKQSYTELEEVVVSAQRPPVLIKKDTLEFDAGSFRTAPNSVVEDLLKQLPGMEVDGEGNITVNGQKVAKITVNGRDFFGSDFKITTKNLPRDIIDKIQVMDFKTRFEQFSNIQMGSEDKVINLVLKKDVNKGVFGRGTAGYGSERRYESSANLNYFKGPLQLSAVGYANNINLASFDAGLSGGTGNGITESKGAGLNFNNELGKKLSLNGSYFFNNSNQVNATITRRQNMLPDTSFFYDAVIRNTNDQDEHRLNLKTEYKLDSVTTVTANVVHNHTAATIVTANEAISSSVQGKAINAAANQFSSQSKDNNTSLELFVGSRLNKKGRRISGTINYSNNNRSSRDVNKGSTFFYKADGSSTGDTLDQQTGTIGSYVRFSLSASYTEPITRRLSLELRYTFTRGNGRENKNTQRFNPFTNQYDLADSLFSNTVRTGHRTHFPYMSLGYIAQKFNISLGTGVQWIWQENIADMAKFQLVQDYSNIFPFANMAYRYSQTGTIYLTYTGRSQQPTIDQLQPVPDNRNTLYIRLGNPHLRATFFHNLHLYWRQSGQKTFWNANLVFGMVKNQIVYETWSDSVQFSRPINTNGNYNLTGNLSFSRTWRKKDWFLRLSFTNNGYYNRNVSFSNKIGNTSPSYGLASTLGLSCTYQLITLNPSFSLRYSDTRYSFQPVQPVANLSKTIALSTLVSWPKRFIWENNIQYNHNSRTAPGFPQGVTLWNMALNYQFLKQQQATLRFSVFDLLQQSTSINRSITPTYIEDTQVQVLRQYFLVSFIYNLKQFGK